MFVSFIKFVFVYRTDCMRKKHISSLDTGGTIGMRRSPSGSLAPVKGYLPQLVRKCLTGFLLI